MVNIGDLARAQLVKEQDLKNNNHVSSGKLSAGILLWPTQWQILKMAGEPQSPIPPERLGTLRRGVLLEDELARLLKASGHRVDTQTFVEYRDVVGYVDLLVDGEVVEVKTTAQKTFKRLKQAKTSHVLQSCLYALALEKDDFSVCYIATDNLFIKQYNYKTSKWAPRVEKCINIFNSNMEKFREKNIVPGFSARERWQNATSFNPFPKFENHTQQFKYV
jgi:hypothetical protein